MGLSPVDFLNTALKVDLEPKPHSSAISSSDRCADCGRASVPKSNGGRAGAAAVPCAQRCAACAYQKAAFTPAQVLAIEAGLRQAMECDKRYLESDLTLAQLTQALAVSQHQLSQFLSQHLGLSFYDYVNRPGFCGGCVV